MPALRAPRRIGIGIAVRTAMPQRRSPKFWPDPTQLLGALPRWLAADALGREDRWIARALRRLSGRDVLCLEFAPDEASRPGRVRATAGRKAARLAACDFLDGEPLRARVVRAASRPSSALVRALRQARVESALLLPICDADFGARVLLLLDAPPSSAQQRRDFTAAAELWLHEAGRRRREAALSAQACEASATLEQLRQRAARESHMLEELVAQLPTAVLVVAEDDTIRVLNCAARTLLGLGSTQVRKLSDLERRVGLSLSLLLGDADDAPHSQDVVWDEEGARHLRIDVGTIADGEHVLVLRDITRRRRLELEQAEFVGSVSHELKTPLTALRTALEIILQGEAGLVSEEQAHFLEMGRRNIDRLSRLIQQLLDVARHESGRLELSRQHTDLTLLLAPHLDSFARHARRERRELSWQLPSAAAAHVDADRFVEILENLLGNALKFTEIGGHIRVRLQAGELCPDPVVRGLASALDASCLGCVLEVEDDGRGMEPAAAERAFQRFYQEGDPLANRPSGAGLGLAITRALVAAHDGCVRLSSQKGRGTTVSVWVPQDPAQAALTATVERLGHVLRQLSARLRRGRLLRLEELAEPAALERAWKAQGLDPARLGPAIGRTHFGLVLDEEWRAPLRRALAEVAGLSAEVAFPQRGADLGTLLAQVLPNAARLLAAP